MKTGAGRFRCAAMVFAIMLIQSILPAQTSTRPAEESSSRLPLQVGRYWEFKDQRGKVWITVAAKETTAGKETFRIEWSEHGKVYQGELWAVAADGSGIVVFGRIKGELTFLFDQPCHMLKEPLDLGQEWTVTLSVKKAGYSETLTVSVAAEEEEVVTGQGKYTTRKVILKGRERTCYRWYARGIGLVQGALHRNGKLINQKTLVETGQKKTGAE